MIDGLDLELSLERRIASVECEPYSFQTSHRIDELKVLLADGTRTELLLKNLRRLELDAAVSLAKPDFLDNPQREQVAYRLLAGAGMGIPLCYDAGEDWLLLEKVEGVELWQLGELEAWVDAAKWLSRLHGKFANSAPISDHLLRYDRDYFSLWPRRAQRAHPALARVVARYDRVIQILLSERTTFVHGDFYASNVLVGGDRISAVDWEMAGAGPGVLDLAALVSGWGDAERSTIVAGYGEVSSEALDAAQLHLAVQWLGWSPKWAPPPEHARDWLADALAAAERLEL